MPTVLDHEATDAARATLGSACAQVFDATEADAVDGIAPALVARPGSTEEVAEVMRAAAAHSLVVVPRGRGTKITWGRPPERADLVVDLSEMNQVLDHAAGDLVVETQAGTPLHALQSTLATSGQRLALDEVVPGASVGGSLAAATSGPIRMVAGTLRDLLIGVTVVRADGAVAKAGGRVVKNVAGYDLGKLVHGSLGTLAVVTEAFFRLHPLPDARRFVTVPLPDDGEPAAAAAEAQQLAQAVTHSQVVPAAVEVDLPPENSGAPGSLTVLLEGIEAGVEGRTRTIVALLGERASATDSAPQGWARFPWPLDATGDGRATALKLTFTLSGFADVLTAARGAAAPIHLRGSVGVGVMYALVPAGTEAPSVAKCVDRLRAVCRRHGGSLVVLDAPAAVKETVDVWGPVPALDLMRRVKAQFDPDRQLAPGRFVGGI